MKGPVANFGGCSGPTEDRPLVLRDPLTCRRSGASPRRLGRYLSGGRAWRGAVGIGDLPTFLAENSSATLFEPKF